jgi:MOSC domain-containing protein YiiM
MIVRRPAVGEREVLQEGQLDPAEGLVGDSWCARGDGRPPNVDVQLTLMNARLAALVAQDKSRWPLAGDQLYIDLDLSDANLPPGSHLAIGSSVIRVSAQPHTGCGKFVERFDMAAMELVNGTQGKALRLHGINARVVQPGLIRIGDKIRKQSGGSRSGSAPGPKSRGHLGSTPVRACAQAKQSVALDRGTDSNMALRGKYGTAAPVADLRRSGAVLSGRGSAARQRRSPAS